MCLGGIADLMLNTENFGFCNFVTFCRTGHYSLVSDGTIVELVHTKSVHLITHLIVAIRNALGSLEHVIRNPQYFVSLKTSSHNNIKTHNKM